MGMWVQEIKQDARKAEYEIMRNVGDAERTSEQKHRKHGTEKLEDQNGAGGNTVHDSQTTTKRRLGHKYIFSSFFLFLFF